ncbi:TonB-dependent receptor [Novosphingobium kaempferiae]|uniref:TonB-dependent receptor n=1 Tax=Novosphingobium kaempferiae TaxID=2896849 RepID=UPI001E40DC87|nr:TonB-dependent receptor [Novosphingobium kaempferiae]
MMTSRWIMGVSAAALFIGAQPALAQDAADESAATEKASGVGSDIVVTAQRREQSLQDVPIAVSAISADALVAQEATSTQGLLRMFPNVSGAQITGAGANNYSIRGLSNAETAATFDSPVGTYIDGIYLSRVNSNNFALFDIERIEVMRGPQGTLFGRNTTGGAINVVLKQPGKEMGASVEGSYGNYDSKSLRGSIDMPIGEHIRTRLSGYWMDEDGYVKNITTGGTENDHDGWGVRGAVSIDLSSAVTWDISVDHIHDENSLIPATKVDGKWISRTGLQKLGSIVTGKKGDIEPNRVINDTTGVTSKLTIDASIGTIQFITGYRHLRSKFNLDYFDNPSTIGGYDSVQYSKHNQFSQEANISGELFGGVADYTAGLFYFHEYNDTDFTTVFRLGSGAPFVDADRTVFNTTDSFAMYGQFDWHLTDKLTLTTGGRWTTDTKKMHYEDNGNPRASVHLTDQTLLNAGIPLTQTASVFTPRVALTYQATPDVMLFASATKGFKSGGWNVRATTTNLLGDFEAETIWSFEGGVRSEFFDRKVTFNLTGFYGYTKNLQIATANGASSAGVPVFPVGNFSDFRSYGLEAEANFRPIDGLSIFANAGYNKTEYANPTPAVLAQQAACEAALAAGGTSSNCGGGIIRLDGTIAAPLRAPKFTGTVGFSWDVPVTDTWSVVPSSSFRYVSSFNVNAAELPTTYDDGYSLLAGSLALENKDAGMRFSIGCENCTNSIYRVATIAGYSYWSPPRRWTARARFDF